MKIAAISIADYCEAVEGLPHDAERLYFRMLLKMHSREAGLPDDDADSARMFGYDVRRFRRLKAILLQAGVIRIAADGTLVNERALVEIESVAARRQKRKSPPDRPDIPHDVAPEVGAKSARSQDEVAPKLPAIPHTTMSGIKGLQNTSPSPAPKEENTITVFSQQQRSQPNAAAPLDRERWQALEGQLFAAAGTALANPAGAPGLLHLGVPIMWLESGCDLDRDVLTTIRAVARKPRRTPIGSWEYFSKAIAEARDRRLRGLPEAAAGASRKPTIREVIERRN
jgi:hypothetical protein